MSSRWDSEQVIFRGRGLMDSGPTGDFHRLIFDDGMPNMALQVEEFRLLPICDSATTPAAIAGVLTVSEGGAYRFDLSNESQLAWFSLGQEGSMEIPFTEELIDTTNIVIRDLFIQVWNEPGIELEYNYYVRARRRLLDDNTALIALSNEVASLT